ncbi:hypothetical protein NUH87_25645 [Pseudomonas batumici]|uniref:hypothetical protein n=1 Tax=Pseudomonas batumici TaxID=226910 RepID=UPI0030CEFB31
MASSVKTSNAYSRTFPQRLNPRQDLGPTILDCLSGPGIPTGLMPVDKLDAPLRVEIQLWDQYVPAPIGSDKMSLIWRLVGDENYTVIINEEEFVHSQQGDFPIIREIPVRFFESYRHGVFEVFIRKKSWNNGQETDSAMTQLIIDREAPELAEPPTDAIEIAEPVITDDTLSALPEGVVCVIPDFTEQYAKPLVKAAILWTNEIPEDNGVPFDRVMIVDPLPPDRTVVVPRTTVEPLGSGEHYVVYFLCDIAGTWSRMSWSTKRPVALGRLPNNLPAPTVDQQELRGVVDMQGVNDKVHVIISSAPDGEDLDHIRVTWGTRVVSLQPQIGTLKPFPLKFPMPWADMRDAYDFALGGDQPTLVSYEVLRGIYPRPSQGTYRVKVNFDYAGPPIPDPDPTPVNPDLHQVEVWGETATTVPNKLVLADATYPATAKVRLYGTAAEPPEVGTIITCYWAGAQVDRAYRVDGNEDLSVPIEFTIPWTAIEEVANDPAVPAYYTVTHPDHHNPKQPIDTLVDVEVLVEMLPDPTFPDNFNGLLSCVSLRQDSNNEWGIWVKFPASKYIKEGDTVEATWQSYDGSTDSELPGTDLAETWTVTDIQEAEGIDWFIPYYKCLEPTYVDNDNQYGYASVLYSRGSVNSEPSFTVYVAMGASGEEVSCIIPPP